MYFDSVLIKRWGKMSDLEELASGTTRRDFLRKTIYVGAGAIASTSPISKAFAQQPNSKLIGLENPYYSPTKEDLEDSLRFVSKEHNIPISKLKFHKAYQETWFTPETELIYANQLKIFTPQLTADLERALGKNFQQITIDFRVPLNSSDVAQQPSLSNLVMNLVADLGRDSIIEYKEAGTGKIYLAVKTEQLNGEAQTTVKLSPSYEITTVHKPVFVITRGDLIEIVMSPQFELMHRLTEKYAYKHLGEEMKSNKVYFNSPLGKKILEKHLQKNEVFVHAFVYAWFLKYNAARGQFTEAQIQQRMRIQDSQPRYNGVIRMAEHLLKIGPEKAIELYKNNIRELFRGARLPF